MDNLECIDAPPADVLLLGADAPLAEMLAFALARRGRRCAVVDPERYADDPEVRRRHERAPVVVVDVDGLNGGATALVSGLAARLPGAATLAVGRDVAEAAQVGLIEAGAADYVVKPLKLALLVARIDRHLTRLNR